MPMAASKTKHDEVTYVSKMITWTKRLFAFALIALFLSRYPLALVLVGVGGAAIWFFYFNDRR